MGHFTFSLVSDFWGYFLGLQQWLSSSNSCCKNLCRSVFFVFFLLCSSCSRFQSIYNLNLVSLVSSSLLSKDFHIRGETQNVFSDLHDRTWARPCLMSCSGPFGFSSYWISCCLSAGQSLPLSESLQCFPHCLAHSFPKPFLIYLPHIIRLFLKCHLVERFFL